MKKHIFAWVAAALLVSLLAGCAPRQQAAEETEKSHLILSTTVPQTEAETTAAPETEPETTAPTEPETTAAPQTEPEPTEPPATEPPATEAPATEPPKQDGYYVAVNCETNTVTIYTRDSEGNFTVPYKAMVCSSGLDESPTPTGTYNLTGNRWEWLEMVGGVWGMYVTQITGNYLFHSVPYTEYGNHGSLQEGQYDLLGEDASHGCIRLTAEDAKWIYDNMWNIQKVELFNSPEPGPLGKPMALKIGGRAYPGWDPTDMTPGNPWHAEG